MKNESAKAPAKKAKVTEGTKNGEQKHNSERYRYQIQMELTCKKCGRTWVSKIMWNEQLPKRLPRVLWMCPNGCNWKNDGVII